MVANGSRTPRELQAGGGDQSEGMYNPGGGGEGCSGSMKRTPTAEEREREAKVCGGLRSLGSFLYLERGAGNRRDLAGGRADAWSEAKAWKGLVSKETRDIGGYTFVQA